MQVHLKQSEIVTALKQYISGEGISLQGKTVDMVFTAGRKESGISVEISIDDAGIPDFFKDAPDETAAAAPALSLVKDANPPTASTANGSTAPVASEAKAQSNEDGFFNAEDGASVGEPMVVEAEPVTLVPAGKSLFN